MVNKISVLQNLKNVYSDPYPHIIIENCLPEKIHNDVNEKLTVPMVKGLRSINVSSAVAIVVGEACRQLNLF